MGGSSTNFPDIVVTNNRQSLLLVSEAKASTDIRINIPPDELDRCFDIAEMFSLYKNRYVLFAFKFLGKCKVKHVITKRPIKEYYFLKKAEPFARVFAASCSYANGIKINSAPTTDPQEFYFGSRTQIQDFLTAGMVQTKLIP